MILKILIHKGLLQSRKDCNIIIHTEMQNLNILQFVFNTLQTVFCIIAAKISFKSYNYK